MVRSVDSQTTACKGLPQKTLVGTAIAIYVRLDPGLNKDKDKADSQSQWATVANTNY
jgi:hypothetical protein